MGGIVRFVPKQQSVGSSGEKWSMGHTTQKKIKLSRRKFEVKN